MGTISCFWLFAFLSTHNLNPLSGVRALQTQQVYKEIASKKKKPNTFAYRCADRAGLSVPVHLVTASTRP